jgi:hypothetical protein
MQSTKKRRVRLVPIGLLIAGWLGCGSSGDADSAVAAKTQPILNGAFDPGDPATVLIGGGGGWSSGALVSPHVVLTCGHCVDPQGSPRNFVYFGSSYLDGGVTIAVERAYPHPGYVSGAFPNVDIGIVVLKSAANVTPVHIEKTVLDGGVVGAPLRIVGFGATSPSVPEFSKMQVTVPLTGIDPNYLLVGPAICAGDSGGPGFLDAGQGQEVIAGVVSWHTANGTGCGGKGGLARVDLHAEWIQAQIDAAEDGGVQGEPPDGGNAGPDGGAPDSGIPASDGGTGGGDGGASPSGGASPDPQGAISGGCSAGGEGSGSLLALVLSAFFGWRFAWREARR